METIEDHFNPEDPLKDIEEDDDDDGSALPTKKLKAGQDLWELFTKREEKENRKEPKVDKTPELDGEAPVEHLSRAEEVAISQTLAEERLAEMQKSSPSQLTNEHLTALNYVEAVSSTGYVEEEFDSITNELGIKSDELENESEEAELEIEHSSPKTKQEKDKETDSIVSYLISRRKGRLKSKDITHIVEEGLHSEVSYIRDRLENREQLLRKIVRSKEASPSKSKSSEKSSDKLMPKEILDPVQAEIRAQTINREELLKIASEIEIEGTRLSVIYSNNLLGEHGLRRVIAEYLKGGDVKRVLKREMIEREMDYERDPVLRDRGEGTPVDTKPSSIEDLVQNSGINWDENKQEEMLTEKPKKKPKTALIKPISEKRKLRALDYILVLLILGLLLTLIIILISK